MNTGMLLALAALGFLAWKNNWLSFNGSSSSSAGTPAAPVQGSATAPSVPVLQTTQSPLTPASTLIVNPATGAVLPAAVLAYNPTAAPSLDTVVHAMQALGGAGLRPPGEWINIYNQATVATPQYAMDLETVFPDQNTWGQLWTFDQFWQKAQLYLGLTYGMSGLSGGWDV